MYKKELYLGVHKIEVFKCFECNAGFLKKKDRETHFKTVHGYKCKDCSEDFKLMNDLKAHVKSVHWYGVFKCEECGKEFNNRGKLREHIKVHTGRIKGLFIGYKMDGYIANTICTNLWNRKLLYIKI